MGLLIDPIQINEVHVGKYTQSSHGNPSWVSFFDGEIQILDLTSVEPYGSSGAILQDFDLQIASSMVFLEICWAVYYTPWN